MLFGCNFTEWLNSGIFEDALRNPLSSTVDPSQYPAYWEAKVKNKSAMLADPEDFPPGIVVEKIGTYNRRPRRIFGGRALRNSVS